MSSTKLSRFQRMNCKIFCEYCTDIVAPYGEYLAGPLPEGEDLATDMQFSINLALRIPQLETRNP